MISARLAGTAKRKLHRCVQYVYEKVGKSKATALEEEFIELERKFDVYSSLVEDVQVKTKEFLQPNPTARVKLAASQTYARFTGGHAKDVALYPQPEVKLGDCMTKYGNSLGPTMAFGEAMINAGNSYTQLGEIKDILDNTVKQEFLDPLHALESKELKEVNHHRKKLEGRRLDYDLKKRKKDKVDDIEFNVAKEKFLESKELCQEGMMNVLNSEVEQVGQLLAFVSAHICYHQNSLEVLTQLKESLLQNVEDAKDNVKVKNVKVPINTAMTPKSQVNDTFGNSRLEPSAASNAQNGDLLISLDQDPFASARPAQAKSSAGVPSCKALYDFDAESAGELGFKEGQLISLLQRVDENWFEGCLEGRTGLFPVEYVSVVNPLPAL